MSGTTSRIAKFAAVAAVVLGMALTAAGPASAGTVVVGGGNYCQDYGLCNPPRYTVYYTYDWYYSGDRLSRYQIRLCNWVSPYGYVYAISYC